MSNQFVESCQFLIIGSGIVGLTLANELVKNGHTNILLIDKESYLGAHASGRNSGVLHSGIYYEPGTLKAQFCLEGNYQLKAYCKEHNIDVKPVGKVVVARSPEDCETINQILKKSQANNVPAQIITPAELAIKEPLAKTHQLALWSPETAVVDPKQVVNSLRASLEAEKGVRFLLNTQYLNPLTSASVDTSSGPIKFDYLINTSGAHADTIAHDFGVGTEFQSIPFKGTYRKYVGKDAVLINGNIYPVPNLLNPFLGVHFTKSYAGDVYVGPTAIPAFGRENYGILKGIDGEAFKILKQTIKLFFTNAKFRQVALNEPQKYLDHFFYKDANKLVTHLNKSDLEPCQKLGIRPQLVNRKTGELVMDFKVVQTTNSLHVINAISPAFTCSMRFAKYLYQTYIA